jgi:hypothetical protein
MPALKDGARLVGWLGIGAIAALIPLRVQPLQGGAPGVPALTITTDQTLYQPGDSIQICYQVPSAGGIEIDDQQPGLPSSMFFTGSDDGTGGCVGGVVTPPLGRECLTLVFHAGDVMRRTDTCFEVAGPASGPVPPHDTGGASGSDCGTVTLRGPVPLDAGAASIEGCFYQAFQDCAPATLEVLVRGVDTGVSHSFSITSTGGGCVVADAAQRYRAPGGSTSVSTTCTGVSQTPDGGLLISGCGSLGDVQVPAS